MFGAGNAVLLEGSIDCVAGQLWGQAQWLIGLHAEGAGQAGVVEPLDTDGLAHLAVLVRHTWASCNDIAGTLVASDQGQFGRDGPVTIDGV